MHTGVAAFNWGEVGEVRELLTSALERGARDEGRSSTGAGREHLADRTADRRRGGRRLWVVGPIGSCPEPGSCPASGHVPSRKEPLPVPAASESALSRARALFKERQLREALRAFNGVTSGDSLRSEADLLRSAVQRALLAGSGEPADEVGGG